MKFRDIAHLFITRPKRNTLPDPHYRFVESTGPGHRRPDIGTVDWITRFRAKSDRLLAWRIHKAMPDFGVRLEFKPFPIERMYIDLWLPGIGVAVELKYCTRILNLDHDGESFALRNQSAHDIRRYDFLRDIQRMEQLSALPNDDSYWKHPSRPDTVDAAFRLHDGRRITGEMAWSERAGPGTTKKREQAVRLNGAKVPARDTARRADPGARRRLSRHLGAPDRASGYDAGERCDRRRDTDPAFRLGAQSQQSLAHAVSGRRLRLITRDIENAYLAFDPSEETPIHSFSVQIFPVLFYRTSRYSLTVGVGKTHPSAPGLAPGVAVVGPLHSGLP